ncbi:MAG: O-antigen ligase family protein [Candidatus Gracilibacteria bacterium]
MQKHLAQLKFVLVSLFVIPLVYFPFLHFSFTEGKELTFKAILLLGLILLSTLGLKKKKFQLRQISGSPLFLLLCAVLALHALSNFLSGNPLVTLYGTYSRGGGFILELYLFAFMAWIALTPVVFHKCLKWFWISSALVALYACAQKLGLDVFFQNYSTNLFQGRVFSFSGNPSLLGQLMLLSTIVSFYLFNQTTSRNKKIFLGVGTLLMLAAMIFSETRAAVLGLMGVSFLGVLRYRKFNVKLLLLLPLLIALIWAVPSDRFSLSQLSLRSLNSRFQIWEGTVELIQDKWLLGYGQETFYIHFPEVITREFLNLEEDITISADRVHNEWLEEIYNHGILAGALYLVLLGFVLKKFFTSHKKEEVILCGLILANSIQNQLSFPDITIQMLMAFSWGSLVAFESETETLTNPLNGHRKLRLSLMVLGLILTGILFGQTVLRPLVSHRLYTVSQQNYSEDYTVAVNSLKKAITWTPYYSELWYELMFIDPSSMERALANLELIDGESGDVLAWKGNYYAGSDPQLSAEYYLRALEKNPSHPNWIRAFADMLYDQGDCETALFLYTQYLEAVPDYWKWTLNLEEHSEAQQKSYETFFKHVPYFWGTLEKMETCRAKLDNVNP